MKDRNKDAFYPIFYLLKKKKEEKRPPFVTGPEM